ncbi:MAG: L-seryl-tRNA(Sec) selenium transferase [Ardenticatenales bacterium]
MSPSPTDPRRALPAVDALADAAAAADPSVADAGRGLLVAVAREVLDAARAGLGAGDSSAPNNGVDGRPPALDALVADVTARLSALLAPRPRRVVNATGVVLHTNLGRAPVSAAAAAAMAEAAAGYNDLEYDLATGKRGSRHDVVAPLLARLSGAEAALVVNNNAGATLLVVAALAAGRDAIVSRGQLVEIGGGYRIPDVMAAGGARLVEVGTTNRTRLSDYERAIGEASALLLRVHTSNFRITGFTASVGLDALVDLGRRRGVPVVDDLGSGSFIDVAPFGLSPEPTVQESVAAGADAVTFSGDKLLGGPQAGLIVGRADVIARLRAHPLCRALRPDKATLAGLAVTLRTYLTGRALDEVPVWRMIAADVEGLRERAEGWREAIVRPGGPHPPTPSPNAGGGGGRVAEDWTTVLSVRAAKSTIGGGSLPGETLPTFVLAIDVAHPDAFAARLRVADVPVIARVEDGAVVLDPRTVLAGEDEAVVGAVRRALAGEAG